ncbi:unnamed protein product [Colias eurytheme]|nr:unnamed protein product [Colias eurytheme]
MLLTKVVFFVSYICFAVSLPPAKSASLLPLSQVNYQNEHHLRDNFQTRAVQQENSKIQQLQGLRVQNSPQNFQTNFRSYLGSGINDKLQYPRPILVKPFNADKPLMPTSIQEPISPTLREAPPSNQIFNRNINHLVPNNNNQPPLYRNVPQIPTENYLHNNGQQIKKKSFTIIHPNGTTEEADNLEEIIKMYPIHTIVKASEFHRNLLPINQHPATIKPQQAYAKNPIANPTLVPLFDVPVPTALPKDNEREILYTNTLKDFEPISSPDIITDLLLPNTANPNAHGNPLNKKNISNIVLDLNTVNSNFSTKENDNTGVVKSNKTVSEPQSIKIPNWDSQKIIPLNEKVPEELNESQAENNVVVTIDITPDLENNYEADIIPLNDIYTIEIALENDTKDETTDSKLIDSIDTPIETKKCDEDTKIDIPNIALLPDNDTESSFWFQSDERFLVDRLLKDKNTVFFFIPKVNLEKNTTITIYPNGTRIEETRVVKNDGSKPVVTTIITHANDEEVNKS